MDAGDAGAALGGRIVRHDVVDSTNERAFAALAAGEARHGDAHVARAQTAGRGRRGRPWESAAGEGLYASFVLRPPGPPPSPAGLTVAAGLACRDAVAALGLQRVRMKWPNDVLVGEAKLAGVLVEARPAAGEPPAYVVGVGVNVAQRSFPAALVAERPVTSLALEGVAATPEELLPLLARALGRRLSGLEADPARLARDWLEATGLGGTRVRVLVGREELAGRLLGIDLARGLELEVDGRRRTLEIAWVSSLEACDGRSAPG